jgi:cardiolipin synthase
LTVPNLLTASRIASVPFINYFVLINKHEYACALFFASGVTDFLDGYIARNFKNQRSNIGSILDPLADKLLIGSLTLTLTLSSMMPLELAVIILGRDVALVLFSLYVRYTMIEKPVTLSKYINVKKYATVQVHPDTISKVNTALQIALITVTLPSVILGYQDSSWLLALQMLTGSTTVISSLSYLYKRGSYKVVK